MPAISVGPKVVALVSEKRELNLGEFQVPDAYPAAR